MADKLDELLGERRTGPGCRVCGKPTDATVKVLLQRQYLTGRGDKRASISSQAVLCGDHAVEIYELIRNQIP